MQAGILSGPEIRRQVQAGTIEIDPYNPARINPASIDLTLGDEVGIYRWTYSQLEIAGEKEPWVEDGSRIIPMTKEPHRQEIWDSRKPREIDKFKISDKGWVLYPGIGYLLHTKERVTTNHFVPVLDGKSSIGRAFILVHYTAGYGDPGFDGQYTLEVSAQIPIRIYAGMRFCQMRFHTLVGEPLLYHEKGHYKGDSAKGAVASHIYDQFDNSG